VKVLIIFSLIPGV